MALERAGRKIFKVHLNNIFLVFLLVIVCLKVGNEVKASEKEGQRASILNKSSEIKNFVTHHYNSQQFGN